MKTQEKFEKLRTLELDGKEPYAQTSTIEQHRLRRMKRNGDVMYARDRLLLKAYENGIVDHRGAEWLHIDSLPVVIEAAFYKMERADRAKWLYEKYLTTVEKWIKWASEHGEFSHNPCGDISEGGGTHRYYIDELGFIVISVNHGGIEKGMRCGFRPY